MPLRVEHNNILPVDSQPAVNPTRKTPIFQQELTRIENTQQTELNQLIKDVEEKGTLLAKDVTLQNLESYRLALQKFLKRIADNYGLNKEYIHGYQSNKRILTTIRKIEQNLADLAEEVSAKNANQLNILTKIDTIRGLLIDLYT